MKSYKRLFAIFLSLVFIFNSTIVNVFAYNSYDSINYSNEHITIFEVNDTRIDSYEDDLGNTILEQYVNGKLTQRDTVKYGYSSQALAVWFHNEMFSYSVWDVVGWS